MKEINRDRKIKKAMNRLGHQFEFFPNVEVSPSMEFSKDMDLSDNDSERALFSYVHQSPIVEKTRYTNYIKEETIHPEVKARDVECEIDFDEMYEKIENADYEEPGQDETKKVVRFDETVTIQEHESVRLEYMESGEEDESEEYEYCEEESDEDIEDHGEEFEEVTKPKTEELQQISLGYSVFLTHEVEGKD